MAARLFRWSGGVADFPGWPAVWDWVGRVPFVRQWARMPPDWHARVLAFWIEASETDAWTRDELSALFAHCMDAGAIPPPLQAWVNDNYTGRLPPIRKGPKTDHFSDYRIMGEVEFRKMVFSETDHAARRAIAEELNPASPQYDKVRGAHERGRRWPPEVRRYFG